MKCPEEVIFLICILPRNFGCKYNLHLFLQQSNSVAGKMDGIKSVIPERSPSPAQLPYTSEKHPKGTLAEINLLRSHRELCDVVLNVGIRKIFAHRYVSSYIISNI